MRPVSATNTLEQTYRAGHSEARRKIVAWLESIGETALAKRVKVGEYEMEDAVKLTVPE